MSGTLVILKFEEKSPVLKYFSKNENNTPKVCCVQAVPKSCQKANYSELWEYYKCTKTFTN